MTSDARHYLTQPELKKKRPLKWLNIDDAPSLSWRDGEAVTRDELQKIFGLLVLEGPETFNLEHWTIFAALDPDTRIPFSVHLETQWLAAGGKPAHKWCIYQLAAMGAIEHLLDRAAELIELATHGKHKRALWYLEAMTRAEEPRVRDEIFCASYPDVRSWVFDLSIHAPYESTLHTTAKTWHEHLLTLSGLSRAEYLEGVNFYIREEHIEAHIDIPNFVPDRTTLTLLDQEHTITFVDDGFELGLRHTTTRKISSGFPKLSAKHDPTTWRVAHDIFTQTQAQLTPFIDKWKHTFEHAMISARPYAYNYLEERFLSNRLMSHLIESLVWITREGQTIRLLEGSCFDVDYDEVSLPKDTWLKLVHPLEITPDEAKAWGAQLAEDEVFPLFPQLTRNTYNHADHPFNALYTSSTLQAGKILEILYQHGWRHGGVYYGNYETSYHLLPGRDARIWLKHSGLNFNEADSKYTRGFATYTITIRDLNNTIHKPSKADPVVYSEAYRLVEELVVAMSVGCSCLTT